MTPAVRVAAGLTASALLFALYAAVDAAWPLGFVALLPWLLALRRATSWRAALLQGTAMSVLFTAAVLWWFGLAIGAYLDLHPTAALAVLLIGAPLLQPQFIAFALAHHLVGRRFGAVVQTLAATSAWVATEALWPKLLGDTLGHGLHGVDVLRASAALGGAAGLTVLLLLVNAAIAVAVPRVLETAGGAGLRRALADWRTWWTPLALAVGLIGVTSGYGWLRLDALRSASEVDAPVLRVAMVQASLVDYERRRREQGAYAVVREVLDTHFALSYSAVRDHGADALLWSETVYPTTFGAPKSADGAAFDAEIQAFVDATGAPLLFGTYERDARGEYNAAVLLEPGRGRLASYRKTRPFPFTERVPAWLDGPTLRRWLPWAGTWQAGDGAHVLPLRSIDGREVQVLPLICLDDVHPQLAVDGARLGAQAIVGMSNDAWFTRYPRGARLHLAVAAFRSAETGLPQLRVTTNGMSAVIDESGDVLVHTQMGQQAALTGHLVARDPLPTPIVRLGDWVGRAGLAFLGALALWSLLAWRAGRVVRAQADAHAAALLPPRCRIAISVLRLAAGAGLVWLAYDMATRIGWQVQSLDQLRGYALFVLLPLIGAAALRWPQRAMLTIGGGTVLIDRPRERIEIPLTAVARVEPWRLPLPEGGIDIVLGSGRRWSLGVGRPSQARALIDGSTSCAEGAASRFVAVLASLAEQRAIARLAMLDHALLKFGLFPLLPAIIAFQLHQRITYGGAFGEWQSFGPLAWFTGLAIWWGAWSLGLMLLAATLRIGVEGICGAVTLAAMKQAAVVRDAAEWLGRSAFYLGVPAWLVIRLLAG